jgi:hypothetical protein
VGVLGALNLSEQFERTLALYGDAVMSLIEDHGEELAVGSVGLGCALLLALRSREDLAALPAEQRQRVKSVAGPSYRFLHERLEALDPGLKQLPMVKAVTKGGDVAWVAQRNLAAFHDAQKEASIGKKGRKKAGAGGKKTRKAAAAADGASTVGASDGSQHC